MNENESKMQNTEPAATPAPEASGEQGRTFTQEQVNAIIQERLARERAKAEPSPLDAREAALKARESALDCKSLFKIF